MCGRFTLAAPDAGQLRARFGLDERVEIRARFTIAPRDHVLAVVQRGERPQSALLRWGLVPHWAEDPAHLAARTINARAETVAGRPAFRDAFARKRCLILADGFFEWAQGIPHWITREDGAPFAFAGLWATWRPRDAEADASSSQVVEPLRSATIITTAATERLRVLHHRMPVMLEAADEATWIDPATPAEVLHGLLRSYPSTLHRPVSHAVNDARHDAPDCDPPEQAALF